MILSDRCIRAALDAGLLSINPFEDHLLQPASYDLRLGSHMRTMNRKVRFIDPADIPTDTWVDVAGEGCVLLNPGCFVLASTIETIGLNYGYAAQVMGKSSLGRLGLAIHQTAGFVDPGFVGQITLEIKNEGDSAIALRPGMRIAQIAFLRCTSRALRPYGHPELGSHYQGQHGPTAPESIR